MLLKVDTAVIVPVNVAPLCDDTDFKSIESAVAFDAAGLTLMWNFVTAAGVVTQTAVTPTDAGVYDWSNLGGGMYAIEIPASGGVSINNDTEGYGYFTGVATGVLPWRGPTITFAHTNVVDFITGGQLSGTNVGGLSAAERTAIANEVEAQIINEADAEQVLTAITNKIATAFADLDDLSLSAIASAVWQRVLTEGYRATGAEGTAEQLMYEILQNLTEFDITDLTKTVKKLDGSTTAKTYGLNDAENPTSITEAT